jgi:hypothetical protein
MHIFDLLFSIKIHVIQSRKKTHIFDLFIQHVIQSRKKTHIFDLFIQNKIHIIQSRKKTHIFDFIFRIK